MKDFNEIEEDLKIDWLREFADNVVEQINNNDYDELAAVLLLENVKNKVLQIFPEKERQYELIYGRRFKRLFSKKGIFVELFEDKIIRN
ncbi:MAG: hypothetical protein K9M80_05675 [Candidatus Marinimicrobia bacterium]|nr:hypothetical protein [Candidatus Neomarinimicrobiota bacterium]